MAKKLLGGLGKVGKMLLANDDEGALNAIRAAGRVAHEQEAAARAAKNAQVAEQMANLPARNKKANEALGLYHPVGGGIKLSKPVTGMHATTVADPKFNPPDIGIITPEQLVKEEAALFPLVGDRAAGGRYLTHVGENELETPVRLTAGPRYMDANYNRLDPEESAAWESGLSRVTALGRQAERAGADGRPVYGIYTAGSGTNTDFNIMGTNALLQQLPYSKITKKSAQEFDRAMREGTKEFPAIPDWPGILSPDAQTMLLDKSNGIARTKLLGTMGKENFQAMGFPDVPATRKAIIEPELLDVPTNQTGFRLARMDTTGRIIEQPNIPSDYPVAMAGKVAGKLDVPADYKDVFQTHFDRRRLLSQPESGDYYSFSRAHPIQYADDEWLNRLMEQRRLADLKIKEGEYKKGGAVDIKAADERLAAAIEKRMAKGGAVDIEAADARLQAAIDARLGMADGGGAFKKLEFMADGGKLVKGAKKVMDVLTKLPTGTEDPQKAVAAEMAARKAAQQAKMEAELKNKNISALNPNMSVDEFKQMANKGQIHQARTSKEDFRDLKDRKISATRFDINMGHPFSEEYEMGDFVKNLKKSGLSVHDDKMGTVHAGKTKEDVQRLMDAQNSIQYGLSYGYSPEDIAKFYISRRGGQEDIGHAEFINDLKETNKQKFLESSKVKQRVYHGTNKDITAFDSSKAGENYGMDKEGMFFTSNPQTASIYAAQDPYEFGGTRIGANVMPVHLSLKNPLVITPKNAIALGLDTKFNEGTLFDNNRQKIMELAKKGGYDGVEIGEDFIAFNPTQIKSAIGNRGTYDINDPDITKAHGGIAMAKGGKFGNLLEGAKKVGKVLMAPQDEALRLAQERAALPPAKGGLGLPANNTPAQRAKAMGFDKDTYHGSVHDIKKFDSNRASTESHAGRGVYSTDSPKDASENYASIYGADVAGKVNRGMDDLEKDWRRTHQRMKDEALTPRQQQIILGNTVNADNIGVVYPLKVRSDKPIHLDKPESNPHMVGPFERYDEASDMYVDTPSTPRFNRALKEYDEMGGETNPIREFMLDYADEEGKVPARDLFNTIKKEGNDAILYDPYSGDMVSGGVAAGDFMQHFDVDEIRHTPQFMNPQLNIGGEHTISMNPDNVRSRFAAFDPFRKNAAIAAAMGVAAPDLLAKEKKPKEKKKAEGGGAFKTIQWKDAQHFDGGGIAVDLSEPSEDARREPALTEKDWANIKRNAPKLYKLAKEQVAQEASQLTTAGGAKDFALRTGAQFLGGIPDLINLGLMGVDAGLSSTRYPVNLSSEKPWLGSERYLDALRESGAIGDNEFPLAEITAGILAPAGLIKKGAKKLSKLTGMAKEPKKRLGGLTALSR